jgi:1-phosphatidylinositol phosphodiesterase
VSQNWADNDADFVINYDPSAQQSAYIEDLYQINGDNVPPAAKIPVKFDALTSHITSATAGANSSQLFVSFASGFGAGVNDTLTPKVRHLSNIIAHT